MINILRIISLFISLSIAVISFSQSSISGTVSFQGKPIEMAHIYVEGTEIGTYTNEKGEYLLTEIAPGQYFLIVSFLGYEKERKAFELKADQNRAGFNINLKKDKFNLDEVIVSATRTEQSLKNSPILANVLSAQTLENVQACSMSEGLKFQPGLRVETDCQTCNYTQLRMNGLAGGYSQILINGRPIFSPLTGLYGLEQLPVNMVDRVEVIRGGGSSLYGSSAIGGTVNIITKTPKENGFSVSGLYQNINAQSDETVFNGNASIVNEKKNAGLNIFLNKRDREFYDHNGDNFSEAPKLDTKSLGINAFKEIGENQKLEFSISYLDEYRFGGEMRDTTAHFAQQAEERDQQALMTSLDYQINFKNSSLLVYTAFQRTLREHYTGILPDDSEELIQFQLNPPYGNSESQTFQIGTQFDKKLPNFPLGPSTLSIGLEYLNDQVFDEIPAYGYLIDQTSEDLGLFLQNDWNLTKGLSFLSGLRIDQHNLVEELIVSPRLALLYKPKSNLRLRASYGAGFRAPQAFDSDLHIAFAGGGISRVLLDEDLKEERSNSYSLSVDWDKAMEKLVYGFTLEAFHTELKDAFALDPIGADSLGEIFIKRNSNNAVVQGMTLEARANFNTKFQIESGFTIQKSEFQETIEYIDGLAGIQEFIRTPNVYGFANLNFTPSKKFSANLNYVQTGSMFVPHFAGAENQLIDEMIESADFHNVSSKVSYSIDLKKKYRLTCGLGVKNIFNSYQNDFDLGKNRDSNFVYGPSLPRTYFFEIKLGSK